MKIIAYEDTYQKATADLILKVKKVMGWSRPWTDDVEEEYRKGGGQFWLALEGTEVIGTIGLQNKGNGRGYLKRMFVDQNFWGRGAAQALLTSLLEQAHKLHLKTIYLGTSHSAERAIAFYRKNGFQKVDFLPKGFCTHGDIFFKLELTSLK